MKTSDKLGKSLETISLLEKNIKEIIREVDDYDLKRLLKKIDAECLDLHHNITVAKRLAGGDKD